jgi:hypothetical protein
MLKCHTAEMFKFCNCPVPFSRSLSVNDGIIMLPWAVQPTLSLRTQVAFYCVAEDIYFKQLFIFAANRGDFPDTYFHKIQHYIITSFTTATDRLKTTVLEGCIVNFVPCNCIYASRLINLNPVKTNLDRHGVRGHYIIKCYDSCFNFGLKPAWGLSLYRLFCIVLCLFLI